MTDLENARRKRLQALASKFKVYDDDDDDLSTKKRSNTLTLATAAASSSPSRRERTKVVDVDKEINRMSTTGSGKTKNLAGDANFLSSLKAQGFEETQSKTKLVSKINCTGDLIIFFFLFMGLICFSSAFVMRVKFYFRHLQ